MKHSLAVDDRVGHKTSLDKFKKIEMISCIFSDDNEMNLEIDKKKSNARNYENTWTLNNMFLND